MTLADVRRLERALSFLLRTSRVVQDGACATTELVTGVEVRRGPWPDGRLVMSRARW